MVDANESDDVDVDEGNCPVCKTGTLGDDGRCDDVDCESYEMIDTDFIDNKMLCPWCGIEQGDIFEIKGAFDDGERVRVTCGRCSRPFDSECMVSYSFTTTRVDLIAEAEEKRIEDERQAKRLAERLAACQVFTPGMRVRVSESKYADHIRGREGLVTASPPNPRNPFVHVELVATEQHRAYDMGFFPDELTEVRDG